MLVVRLLFGAGVAKAGPQHYGLERAEAAEAKAERIVAEELKQQRWKPEDLAARRNGDAEKVEIR